MTIEHIFKDDKYYFTTIIPEPAIIRWLQEDDFSDWSLSPEKEAAMEEFLRKKTGLFPYPRISPKPTN